MSKLYTLIVYKFLDGSTKSFKGEGGYRLSNSWRNAEAKVRKACKERGEEYDKNRRI